MIDPADREVKVFNAALRLPPGPRTVYLDDVCAGDAALRRRIEELLQASGEACDFLESPVAGPPGSGGTMRVAALPTEKPGDRIGHYKLLQQIGEGGCGVVYMAEQEEPVRRKVALKVIKLGMDTKEVIARFEAERQALALMDHPNIARVFDAGATQAGRPYFVMELVRGIKITDYCDENNLSTPERLDLFMQVCAAIQHAHQKGIIHRDIKPSNILVTINDGVAVPKVIDFGIAKATQGRLTDKTLFTAFEQFMGTPAYMSPEQAAMTSLDVDTRSDIYSLGVLLYELLTGVTPFDAGKLLQAGLDEIRRVIREEEPARPSTKLSSMVAVDLTTAAKRRGSEPPKLIHLVQGDLDWIVMKCLEKNRQRRYETANGMAADIQRHLNNEPIMARPPGNLYRFQKLVQRNKLAFIAATAVAFSLVIGLGFSTVSFLQAKKNLARAVSAEQTQEGLRGKAEKMAEKNRLIAAESRERLIRLQTDEGLRLVEQGDVGGSLPFLAEAAKLSQQDSSHASAALFRLKAVLNQWPKLVRVLLHPGPINQAHLCSVSPGQFNADGLRLLTLCPDHGARIWDMATGRPITPETTNFADISSAGLSPDGRRFAVGDDKDTVWQLDAESGLTNGVAIKMGTRESSYGAELLAFSPDGTRLLTGRSRYGSQRKAGDRWGEARIWDAATRKPVTPAMTHTNVLYGACWSPDGQRIATTSEDETAGVWDAKTGARIATLTMGGRILHAVFSPDGKRMAVAGFVKNSAGGNSGGGARVWDIATGQPVTPLLKHTAQVLDVEFSPDGRRLVSAGMDRAARVWDSFTGEPLTPFFSHDDTIKSARFSPDGRMIATASDDGTARLWEAATGKMLASLRHGNAVQSAEFSPQGSLLVTISEDHFARIWNLASLENRPVELHHRGYLVSASFSPDGTRVATDADSGVVRVWDATHGTCLLTLSNRLRLSFSEAAVFSPDGQRVAAAEGIYDLGTGKQVVAFPEGYHHVQFSSSGQKILLSAFPGTGDETRVFDAITGKPISPPLGKDRDRVIHQATFSPNDKFFATAVHDGYARVYDVATGQTVGPELRHEKGVLYVAFSPDSATLASCSWDNTVRLWDISTGRQRTPPLRHLAQTMGAAFSPDGLRVATASWDNTARIWDVATGHPITPPLRHRFRVEQVVFSPDGRYLLTGSGVNQSTENSGGYNGEACLWDASSGELAAPPFKCESMVRSISFSPDGRRILVAELSGMARIWTLPTNDKPVEDLFAMAQILSGQSLAAAGPEPMEAAALDADFERMRAKYPGEFAFTLQGNESWREQQAAASEWDDDWYAARFHLDWLIQAQPDASSWRERRAHAQAELDKLTVKP